MPRRHHPRTDHRRTAIAQEAIQRGHKVLGVYQRNKPTLEGLDGAVQRDLSDLASLQNWLMEAWPDAVINAAAVSAISDVDRDPDAAARVNIDMPALLAQVCHHMGIRFVHMSTDMVFCGEEAPYRSTSTPSPRSRYGEQKLEAERRILKAAAEESVVLRVALLTGNTPGGRRSPHEALFAQWAAGKTTSLFTDEWRTPVSISNTASAIMDLAERRDLSGIFHWGGTQRLSRHEMGERILAHFNLPSRLVQAALRGDIPSCASRPRDLSLELAPLAGKLKTLPESFDDQVETFIVPKPFREWYLNLED